MLDVARNFHPKAAVLRTLDLIARYKVNVFHLHLTDDEGWRIEMPSLPELTAVGARRGHTLDSGTHLPPAFGSGPDVDRTWGSAFYSRADYVEILRYAAARHIEVIPEIEMPGHARAAIKSMEANQQYRLNDPDDRSVYSSAQGYHDNVMNPALESTYHFIERVVGELVAMHREAGVPLRHIYIFFQAEDGIRYLTVTGVQTCALPISRANHSITCDWHRDRHHVSSERRIPMRRGACHGASRT